MKNCDRIQEEESCLKNTVDGKSHRSLPGVHQVKAVYLLIQSQKSLQVKDGGCGLRKYAFDL
jgi:hypothetical protein